MSKIGNDTLNKLHVLDDWLCDVYGEDIGFNTLLMTGGFSNTEIETLKQEYLSEFLLAIINLLDSYNDDKRQAKVRNRLMMQNYGLEDGKPQALEVLGWQIGVCRERVRQLVTIRLSLYYDPNRQAKLHEDFIAIGRILLDNKIKNQ